MFNFFLKSISFIDWLPFLRGMHYFTMKNNLAIIFAIGILSLSFMDAKPREKRQSGDDTEGSGGSENSGDSDGSNQSGGDCDCNASHEIVSQRGSPIGNCNSSDQTGMIWCYLKKGCDGCEGYSRIFTDKCKSYSKCRVAGHVHPHGSAVIEDWEGNICMFFLSGVKLRQLLTP